jgi:hypothetical protein
VWDGWGPPWGALSLGVPFSRGEKIDGLPEQLIREANGLSWEEMAQQLGITPQALDEFMTTASDTGADYDGSQKDYVYRPFPDKTETERIPYIGYSNETLNRQPIVYAGDTIRCVHCGQDHELGPSDSGDVNLLLWYHCGKKAYVGAVASRSVVGIKPDFTGKT